MPEIFVKNSFCSMTSGLGVSGSSAAASSIGAESRFSADFAPFFDACAPDKNAEKSNAARATGRHLFIKIIIRVPFLLKLLILKSNAQISENRNFQTASLLITLYIK